MKIRVKTIALLLSLLVIATGCSTAEPNMYHWGSYENLIHDMYLNPGDADPSAQVSILTSDIRKAESTGQQVAPGIYAHLGFMYAQLGNMQKSKEAFDTELTLYPESSVFIKGMQRRATAARSKTSESI